MFLCVCLLRACVSVCVANILPCSFLSLQLLALTIQQEKPELEREKTRLLQQEEDKKIQLAQLEESLLEVRLLKVRRFMWRVSECQESLEWQVLSGQWCRSTLYGFYTALLLLDESVYECVQLCKFGLQ